MTVNVLGNDSDRNGDALSVVAVTEPAGGAVVSIVGDGEAVSVVPPAGDVGEVVFEYTVSDGRPGGTATAMVTVAVVSADGNQPPETLPDTLEVGAGARRSVDVVFNDTDPDGDQITLIGVDTTAAPEGAIITPAPEGLVVVSVPEGAPEGPFELPYTVVDDRGDDAPGLLTVIVVSQAENRPPVLLPERLTLFPDEAGSIDVLANDVDAEGDDLSAGGLEALDGSPDAALSPDGVFSFPGAAEGQYRYRYVVSDGTNEGVSFVRVDVVAPPDENAPPVSGLDEVTLPVGLSRVVRVLDNDVDPDGEVVEVVDWDPVDGLDVETVPGVGFRMSATAAPPATILFPYWISDGTNEPVQGTVVVSVSAATAGLPPVAVDDDVELRAGQTSAVRVLGNDYDPDGEVLRIVEPLPSAPGATTQLGESGQWLSVSLAPDAEGDLELRYEIVDVDGNRSSAVLRIGVIRPGTPNRAPVVAADVARTLVEQPVPIDPLANDRDPDGDPLVLLDVGVVGDSGATVEIVDGIVRYTPAPGFTGTDRLTYTVVDLAPADAGEAVPVEGTIAVGVVRYGRSDEETNSRPVAVDDGPDLPLVLIGGGPVELDVRRNDIDRDRDPLTILPIASQPVVGSVEVVNNGRAVQFTPPATGEARQVTFRYTITDGLDQDDATVTVTLVEERVPQRPIARDDSIVLRPGETAVVDVLGNDEDPDGDISAVTIQPSPDGSYRVVPGGIEITAGDTSAQIPYTIIDADGLTAQAVVTVQVAENRRPVAPRVDAEATYETATMIDLAAAGAGDPDLPDDTVELTVEAVSGGAPAVAGDLAVEFTPAPGSTDTATFRYTLTDDAGEGESATGTVTVTITGGPPTNEPPVATSRSVRLEAGTSFPVELDLLVDDTDTDIADLVFGGGGTAQGVVTTDLVGSTLTITAPLTAGDATDTITWTVSDGTEPATATIDVTVVAAVFDPPTARNYTGADRRVINRGGTVTIDVIADAQDNLPSEIRGAGLRIVSVDGGTGGTPTFSGRTVTFTPAAGERSGSFSYTIEDAEGGRAIGRVEVAVLDAPTAPTAVAATATETTVTVTWAPPVDPGGTPVTGYTVALTGGGVSRSQPADASARALTFEGLPDSTTFQITVTATNAVDTSPAAPASVSTVVPLQPPGQVVGLSVTATARETVTATWSPPTTGDAPTLYRYRINGGAPTETTATSVPIAGLGDGVVVEVTVVAVNPADAGPPATASGRTWAPPGPVANLGATAGAFSYTVNWEAPGGGGALSYEIATQEGGGCAGNWRPASPGVRIELSNYFVVQSVCVRAVDANGLVGPPAGPVSGGALTPSTSGAVSPPCSTLTCPAQSIRVTLRNHPPGTTYAVSCNPGSSETIVVNGSGAYDGNHCAGVWPPEPAVGPDTVMRLSGLPYGARPTVGVIGCSRESCGLF
ncbi:MAG: Ig-like domain-containing protein [Acidimicrobiales bacterium]